MKKIIFATGNEGKMREIRMILGDLNAEILSMKEAGISAEVIEDGATFEENAVKKAQTVSKLTDAIVLADDSGLEIDALDKQPGVYSARFMGENTSYDLKNQAILDQLKDVPEDKRSARFVCAIAAAFPDGTVKTVTAAMEGRIGYESKGDYGFGYDPIFYVPEFACYSAQLLPEQKNKISHRGKALTKIKELLQKYL